MDWLDEFRGPKGEVPDSHFSYQPQLLGCLVVVTRPWGAEPHPRTRLFLSQFQQVERFHRKALIKLCSLCKEKDHNLGQVYDRIVELLQVRPGDVRDLEYASGGTYELDMTVRSTVYCPVYTDQPDPEEDAFYNDLVQQYNRLFYVEGDGEFFD